MTRTSPLSPEFFDYRLPEELIAQRPAPVRSASRLLRLDRRDGSREHLAFSDLPGLLRDGDLLVLNDVKVFPARLLAMRETGGRVEVLFLAFPSAGETVPCLVRPGRRIRSSEKVYLPGGESLLLHRSGDSFHASAGSASLPEAVERYGQVPLPPYIRRNDAGPDEEDRDRYQTVYAGPPGAVAAPTAGLHFDEAVLQEIRDRGIAVATVTLHVGPGTFMPVRVRDIRDHRMPVESYAIPVETAAAIRERLTLGGRVVATGTTVVRTLESAFDGHQGVKAGPGTSSLFIHPGYTFRVTGALLTNFHLPRSTLLMLVCAFGGTASVLEAYTEAVDMGYRFYSYGDAMFIE